jgi:hypothetical protein
VRDLGADLQTSRSWKCVTVRIIIAVFLMMAAFNYSIIRPVTDGFHEGEYLGALWTIRTYLSGVTTFPLLVHGPMDYIPSLFASRLSSDQAIIVLTRAINTGIAGLTWILFFDVLLKLLRWNEFRFAAGLASLALFFMMIAIVPVDVVERQQMFLAIRDLFLVAALWCTLRGLSTSSSQTRSVMLLLAGATLAASLYWAYDRFLAAIAFGGGLVLVLLLQRAWRQATALVVGGIAGLLLIPFVAPTGNLDENFANLIYWLKYSSEVWHISVRNRAPAVPTALAMVSLLLIFAKAWFHDRSKRDNNLALAFIAGLLALQAFFLLKYFNLPRQPNNYYFVWPFVLLLAAQTLQWPLLRKVDEMMRDLWATTRAGGVRQQLGFAALTVSLAVIVTNNMAVASATSLRALVRPPADTELMPTAIVELARDISPSTDGCVLLWSNEGIFATALRRPFCTRYMYPVYVSAEQEADLLRQIRAAPPAVVTFGTPSWSMNIYGRTMQQRLPAVDRYLRENYEFSERGGYAAGERRSPQR